MKLLLCIWPSSAFGPAENAEGDGLCVGSGDGVYRGWYLAYGTEWRIE